MSSEASGSPNATETSHVPVPIVGYLRLGDAPRLVAVECADCRARFFDRRSACASCGGVRFESVDVEPTGTIRSFTIVHVAAPGVSVPYVAAIVNCGGTSVRANIINTPADPEHIILGLPVRLGTYSLGFDDDGVEAIGFGFEPIASTKEGCLT
ncbi:hypothetical protein A5761_01740 [Mycolicibacterium setense]|nr:hypothetical protein A5761_01740 [Mycolicibacterium setense]